jgi:energy-coupling factor transporter ATP-binding protein EcfA2
VTSGFVSESASESRRAETPAAGRQLQHFDFFIAHASQDIGLAEQLNGFLSRHATSFLASRNTRPGDPWDLTISDALHAADISVIIVSRSTKSAFYQRDEIAAAVSQARQIGSNHRVVPVYLDRELDVPYGLWVLHGLTVGVDGTIEQIASRLLDLLSEQGSDTVGNTVSDVVQGLCPYKGLAPFGEADAELFFGRAQLVDSLLSRLADHRFVAVVGQSGAGKSSLLRAGLAPAIREGRLPSLSGGPIVHLTPGEAPIAALRAKLNSGPALDQRSALILDGPAVVIIDQFEETFTLGSERSARAEFMSELANLASDPLTETRVVLGLRADYYGYCAEVSSFAALVASSQVLVGAMNASDLRSIIERPAWRCGLRVDEDLVSTILADAASHATPLPLISHALLQTWIRREGNTLRMNGYNQAGGIDGALAATAEAFYLGLRKEDQASAERVFLQLVATSASGPDTRRRVHRSLLVQSDGPESAATNVVARATTARLITVDEDENVELIHDLLIRSWSRLAEWLDRQRDSRVALQRLELAASEWRLHNKNRSYLYRDAQLGAVAKIVHAGMTDSDFIAAAKQSQRRSRVLRRSAMFSVLVFLGAAVALLSSRWLDHRSVVLAKSRASGPAVDVAMALGSISVDVHEVSARQYEECVDFGPCTSIEVGTGFRAPDSNPALAPRRAVVWVSGSQAIAFCRWIGRELPTVEQWETMSTIASQRWTAEMLSAVIPGLYLPLPVSSDGLNFGNVTEWTGTPTPSADMDTVRRVPSRLTLRGPSGKDLFESKQKLPNVGPLINQGSKDTKDAASDIGFRCAI